jgi:hypothetical protein
MRYGVVCTAPTGELSLDFTTALVSGSATGGILQGWAGNGGGVEDFNPAALSPRFSLLGSSATTDWKDQTGRPRQETAGRELALAGVFLASVLPAPVSAVLDPLGTSNLGRFGAGSLSCDSGPPAVRSTTPGSRVGGCKKGVGLSDWWSYCPNICTLSSRPGPPLNVRRGWPHDWPPAEEWGIIFGS